MLTEVFRLTKAFVAVKFDADGQGSLVTLPAGAEVGLLGSSVVPGCVQIVYNDDSFSIFEEDLRGHSSSRFAALALVVSNRNLRRTGRHLEPLEIGKLHVRANHPHEAGGRSTRLKQPT